MIKENHIKPIVHKYLRGESNREELEKALDLFADPYHNLALRPVLFKCWEKDEDMETTDLPHLDNADIILDKIHHRIRLETENKTKSPAKKILMNIVKVAAVLVFGLIAGFLAHNLQKTEPVYYTSIAPKGSISQMVLPDNTMVFLNSGSEIKYAVEGNKKKREVFLTGEAWFDVAKNEKKPFVVHTPIYDVKVLGTQFNVKAYPTENEIVTTLEKGSVEITPSALAKAGRAQALKPGQQLIYKKNSGNTSIQNVRTRMFTSWRDNRLIFVNMNLKELFVLLERKYGVDIEVADNVVLNYHYDSTITNETILEVLDLIAETLPIKYKIEEQQVIIQKK